MVTPEQIETQTQLNTWNIYRYATLLYYYNTNSLLLL